MTSDELVEALRNRHGVEPLSHEFIFSPTLARARNAAIVGSGPRQTVLSVLLYDLMTEAQRSQLYGGKFDLGSSLVVSREEQTYDELLGEIERGDRSAKDYEQQGIDAFKTIKAGILKMTGQKVEVFAKVDKLVTLKVIKLFYRLMRDREKQSIFGLLAAPEISQKAGMEYREAYPNSRNEASTWLVADLRSYLGIELSASRRAEIDITFDALLSVVQSVEDNVKRVIAHFLGNSRRRALSMYAAMVDDIAQFQYRPRDSRACRLDETLYIYVSSLEFRHFAQIYPHILSVGKGDLNVVPIDADMRNLLSAMERDSAVEFVEDRIPLRLVKPLANRYATELREIIGRAIGAEVQAKDFDEVAKYAERLLARVGMFEPGQVPSEARLTLTFWQWVAAFCAVHVEMHVVQQRTNHKPYWFGQKNQGGSLLASLLKPHKDAEVLEEHTQIWRLRLEWFQAATGNYLDLFEQKMALRCVLLAKVANIAVLHDTEAIAQELARFLDSAKESYLRAVHGGARGYSV
ncbi:hypothetical protein [Ralstonia pseudosolanacearum]|uniref:hypothetical protein n=1 Tax=Ralstonia pseudosolanacearum TaxID=1310165 RepID=UPI003AAF6EA3